MPTKLSAADVALIAKASQGQTLSPADVKRIDALAAITAPGDPNFKAITTAYAGAHHKPALPSATAAPSSPKPANPVGDVTAGNAAPQPNSPAAVAAKIAAGGYAGAATGGSPPSVAAAQSEQQADQGPSDIPGQGNHPWYDIFSQPITGDGLAGLLGTTISPTVNWNTGDLGMRVTPGAPGSSPIGTETGQTATDASSASSWQATLDAIGGGAQAPSNPYHTGDQTAWNGGLLGLPDQPGVGNTVAAGTLDPGVFGGYTFSRMAPAQLTSLLTDKEGPALEAMNIAQQAGGGQGTAYNLTPYVQAAIALAPTGVLGQAADNTAMGGPVSSAYQLKAVEDFIKAQNAPGGYVDPNTLMNATLDRMANTPQDQFSKLASLGIPAATGTAGAQANVDDQINATNNAMQAVAQLSFAPDSSQSLNKVLAMATIQYKQMLLADPTITMSYPAYLKTFIPQMFGTGG